MQQFSGTRGAVSATGGYFGALQLLADVEARFRVPAGGGRPTDPRWTERRLVPLAPRTLERLEAITAKVRQYEGVNVEPMQLAALLLEKTTEQISDDEVSESSVVPVDDTRADERRTERTCIPEITELTGTPFTF